MDWGQCCGLWTRNQRRYGKGWYKIDGLRCTDSCAAQPSRAASAAPRPSAAAGASRPPKRGQAPLANAVRLAKPQASSWSSRRAVTFLLPSFTTSDARRSSWTEVAGAGDAVGGGQAGERPAPTDPNQLDPRLQRVVELQPHDPRFPPTRPLTQALGSLSSCALHVSVHSSLGGASQHGSIVKDVRSTTLHCTVLRGNAGAVAELQASGRHAGPAGSPCARRRPPPPPPAAAAAAGNAGRRLVAAVTLARLSLQLPRGTRRRWRSGRPKTGATHSFALLKTSLALAYASEKVLRMSSQIEALTGCRGAAASSSNRKQAAEARIMTRRSCPRIVQQLRIAQQPGEQC